MSLSGPVLGDEAWAGSHKCNCFLTARLTMSAWANTARSGAAPSEAAASAASSAAGSRRYGSQSASRKSAGPA